VFILNNDLWLAPDCVELALRAADESPDAQLLSVRVVDYDDDTFQGFGSEGFDWFGMGTCTRDHSAPRELFCGYGCAFVIRKDCFFKVGAYPPELLIYGDEMDLGWRVWASGGRILSAPAACVHHRGAAGVNPAGGTRPVELRTTEMKRYLSVRNGLLLLLKNCQHLLLLLLLPHLLLLGSEALCFLVLTRDWKFVRNSYIKGITDAFRMLPHVRAWRKKIKGFRQHGDFWMLRFLHLVPGRLSDLKLMLRLGAPKVDVKK